MMLHSNGIQTKLNQLGLRREAEELAALPHVTADYLDDICGYNQTHPLSPSALADIIRHNHPWPPNGAARPFDGNVVTAVSEPMLMVQVQCQNGHIGYMSASAMIAPGVNYACRTCVQLEYEAAMNGRASPQKK